MGGRYLVGLALAGLLACTATTTRELPGMPVQGEVRNTYRIQQSEQTVGFLIEAVFAKPGPGQRYLVQNAFGQEVGFVDAQGRAFRYREKDAEPEHVATGTMVENIQAILQIFLPIEIRKQP